MFHDSQLKSMKEKVAEMERSVLLANQVSTSCGCQIMSLSGVLSTGVQVAPRVDARAAQRQDQRVPLFESHGRPNARKVATERAGRH